MTLVLAGDTTHPVCCQEKNKRNSILHVPIMH